MMLIYPAVFHDEGGSVWAEFPDLEGCQTFGDSVEECIVYAQEALMGYAESVIERDLKLPPPSDIRKVEEERTDGFVVPIYCDFKDCTKESKSVKKTLTIPAWLNDKAVKNNVNFSEMLKNALIENLYR